MIGLSHKIVKEGRDPDGGGRGDARSSVRPFVHALEAQIGLNEGLVDNKFLQLDNTLDSGSEVSLSPP